MIDKITRAKQLIKKGVALKDQSLISLGNELLSEAINDVPQRTTVTESVTSVKNELKTSKTPIRFVNTWEDDGIIGHDKDNEVLKQFTQHTERERPPAKTVEVTCSRCHKTSQVSPALYRNYYICPRCASGR